MFTARERVWLHFTDLQTNGKEVMNTKQHIWNDFDWRVRQHDSWVQVISAQLLLINSISKLFLSNLPSASHWTDVSCCSLISNDSFCPTSAGQKQFFLTIYVVTNFCHLCRPIVFCFFLQTSRHKLLITNRYNFIIKNEVTSFPFWKFHSLIAFWGVIITISSHYQVKCAS